MISPPSVLGMRWPAHLRIGAGVTDWRAGEAVVAAIPRVRIAGIAKAGGRICATICFSSTALTRMGVIPAQVARQEYAPAQGGTGFADAALTEPLACVAQGWGSCRRAPDSGRW